MRNQACNKSSVASPTVLRPVALAWTRTRNWGSFRRPMHRPTRKLAHLTEKIASKETRNPKKPGKRAKRWKKWVEQHKTLAQG